MPKPAAEVAADFRAKMDACAESYFTVSWPDFYDACDRYRWTDRAHEDTRSAFMDEGLILGYGNAAVIIAEDANFASL